MVASYRNDKNTVYLSDRGYISEYQRQEEASSCHLVDKENISQYIAETGNKQGDVEVIGVLKEISTINGRLVLDPCYYIKNIILTLHHLLLKPSIIHLKYLQN